MCLLSAKKFVKRHEKVRRAALFLLGKSPPKKRGFRSIAEAVDVLVRGIEDLVPGRFDCYVGVPRAGLLFANILSCVYGAGLATPAGFLNGDVWFAHEVELSKIKRVLVVEDSVVTGRQIGGVVESLKAAFPNVTFESLAIFKTRGRRCYPVDYVLFESESWTLAEWNLLTSLGHVGRLGVDLDGVLCRDCPVEFDDDGPKYVRWLKLAAPLFLPRFKVDVIITSRLEKYRALTEAWLFDKGVRYGKLVMMPLDSKVDRTRELVISFKSSNVIGEGVSWFWESDPDQAFSIWFSSKVPVLNVRDKVLYGHIS